MPGQHHDHGADLRPLRAPGHVGEELQHVGAHRVVREVVLDTPDRLERQRLRQVGQMQLVAIDLAIRPGLLRILEDARHPDVHADLLSVLPRVAPHRQDRQLTILTRRGIEMLSRRRRRAPRPAKR